LLFSEIHFTVASIKSQSDLTLACFPVEIEVTYVLYMDLY